MNRFIAYGLVIQSEIYLLGNRPTEQTPDVFIKLGKPEKPEVNGGSVLFGKMAGVGTFLITEGREIIVEPAADVSPGLLRSALLASAMAVILRQRSLLVLHGSCVSMQGQAIAFLAHGGQGKSTLASALHNAGYPILTDDILAVQPNQEGISIFPSFPLVKLWPEAASVTGKTDTKSDVIKPNWDKKIHEIDSDFVTTPLPLKKLYILDKAAAHRITPLTGQAAFVELVRYSRAAKSLSESTFMNKHFEQCTQLTQQIGVSKLAREYSLDKMPEVIKLIEQDVMDTLSTETTVTDTVAISA